MNKILRFLSILIALNICIYGQKIDNKDMIDHLSLATLMIYDAKYEKAQEELELVDKTSKTFDKAKYYTIVGVLNSKLIKTEDAIKAYEKAIEATRTKLFIAPKIINNKKYLFSIAGDEIKKKKVPKYDAEKKRVEKISELYMHITKEYYKLKDYKNTVISLEKAGEKGKSKASLYTLRAECYYKQKEYSKSIFYLSEGIKKFPKDTKLLKQKFYYFADLKLYQSAIDTSKIYMSKVGVSSKEYIALAQMLIGANQIDSAIKLLEEAKLMFYKDPKIGILLGHVYLKKDMKHTTAHLFEQSSYFDKKYIKDAVEMNRRAGNNLHAHYLNSQNINKVQKLKQKIAIYLNEQEYRKIIGLKEALKRYKMLDDDNLRYTLAYSYYMVGDYKNSERHLKFISDNELFSKATVIRKNIEKCMKNSLECL